MTTNGNRHYPKQHAYGQATEEVIEAITAAVAEREPKTIARKASRIESISLMRWLGRIVGKLLPWARKS